MRSWKCCAMCLLLCGRSLHSNHVNEWAKLEVGRLILALSFFCLVFIEVNPSSKSVCFNLTLQRYNRFVIITNKQTIKWLRLILFNKTAPTILANNRRKCVCDNNLLLRGISVRKFFELLFQLSCCGGLCSQVHRSAPLLGVEVLGEFVVKV